jgi:hypothetical protein
MIDEPDIDQRLASFFFAYAVGGMDDSARLHEAFCAHLATLDADALPAAAAALWREMLERYLGTRPGPGEAIVAAAAAMTSWNAATREQFVIEIGHLASAADPGIAKLARDD